MRPGTPGFIGERLRAARAARGLSAAAMAEFVGVTRAAISHYEKGHQSPSPHVLAAIADRLGLPTHHFLRPVLPKDEGVVFYRSLSTATKGARIKAQQKYQWVREIVAYVRRFVRFPQVNLPPAQAATNDPTGIGQNDVEDAATHARRFWSLGDEPIVNLTGLFEKNGIVSARFSLESEKLDAFSEWCSSDERPYVILNSDKASAARSRFDAAHELAHLILHRRVSVTTFRTRSMFSLMEDQANRFSGAFSTSRAKLFTGYSLALARYIPRLEVEVARLDRCHDQASGTIESHLRGARATSLDRLQSTRVAAPRAAR